LQYSAAASAAMAPCTAEPAREEPTDRVKRRRLFAVRLNDLLCDL